MHVSPVISQHRMQSNYHKTSIILTCAESRNKITRPQCPQTQCPERLKVLQYPKTHRAAMPRKALRTAPAIYRDPKATTGRASLPPSSAARDNAEAIPSSALPQGLAQKPLSLSYAASCSAGRARGLSGVRQTKPAAKGEIMSMTAR